MFPNPTYLRQSGGWGDSWHIQRTEKIGRKCYRELCKDCSVDQMREEQAMADDR